MKASEPKPPEPPLRARTQIEEIHDPALAADMCRRILRAQARTLADHEREKSREGKADGKP